MNRLCVSKRSFFRMFAQVVCKSCGAMGQFSVLEGNYEGPYKCFKCKALYKVEITGGKIITQEPMAESELEEIKARKEAEKKGIPYVPPAQKTTQVSQMPGQPPAADAKPAMPKPAPFQWPQPSAPKPKAPAPTNAPSHAPFQWPQPPGSTPKPPAAPATAPPAAPPPATNTPATPPNTAPAAPPPGSIPGAMPKPAPFKWPPLPPPPKH